MKRPPGVVGRGALAVCASEVRSVSSSSGVGASRPRLLLEAEWRDRAALRHRGSALIARSLAIFRDLFVLHTHEKSPKARGLALRQDRFWTRKRGAFLPFCVVQKRQKIVGPLVGPAPAFFFRPRFAGLLL